MPRDEQPWKPGSFTKNYSWGRNVGLVRLHESIRLGFDGVLEDVPRDTFIQRVSTHERPYQIPANFFLFNQVRDGKSYLVVDELVFKAVTSPYSSDFDKLALFALNFSYAGTWIGAEPAQRYPALWAFYYVKDRVAGELGWDKLNNVNALDIERFVFRDPRYTGDSAHKLSTNLSYIYNIGDLAATATKKVERWWIEAAFLALDRLVRDSQVDGQRLSSDQLLGAIAQSGFSSLTGPESLEKGLALGHLVRLYIECGAELRFSSDYVEELNNIKLNHISNYVEPNTVTSGAVHPTSPRIVKVIPRVCAMLARYAGFMTFDEEDFSALDVNELIRRRTREGLDRIRAKTTITNMSADELMRLTRD